MEVLFYVFETLEDAQSVLDIIHTHCENWDTPQQRVDGKYVISYVTDPQQAWRFQGVPEGQTIEPYDDSWYGSGE